LRVTTSGLVQVDASGGSNEWVTLGSINGTGAVNVRYLSGGQLTTLSVTRVAETYSLMAASVAAAGFAAMPAGGTIVGTADSITSVAAMSTMTLQASEFEPMAGTWAGTFGLAPALELSFAAARSGETGRHSAVVEQLAFDSGFAAHGHAAMPLLEATELVAAPLAMPAMDLVMPAMLAAGPHSGQANAEVARILADALAGGEGGPDIGALLDALPAAPQGLAQGLEIAAPLVDVAWLVPLPVLGLELLAIQADATATV